MAKLDMVVWLDNGFWINQVKTFPPGDLLQGKIRLIAQSNMKCHHLVVTVRWRTNDRGDTDNGAVYSNDLFQDRLLSTQSIELPFQVQLPLEPYSYDGQVVKIVWEVLVKADLGLFTRPSVVSPFLMRPLAK